MRRTANGRGVQGRLREKLPELLLEAGSVVFAVLLALGVDEWRERRNQEALAERARASILEEIRANREELRGTQAANRALFQKIEAALPRLAEDPGARLEEGSDVQFAITYQLALLSSAAWQTAQMTQAAHFMDYDQVTRISRVYDQQALYLNSQSGIVELISSMAELEQDDPHRMFTIIAHRLRINLDLQEALLAEYEGILEG
ncbi:MAG TPA: hypothetical protein VE685_04925 [Thermoanaerobaculia bacterium]|nr:hypothetical protein [Thermoanaerobaculia bacterium]